MQKETRRNSAAGSAKPNPPRKLTRAEKKQIAEMAYDFLEDRDTIIIDDASTSFYLAREIRNHPEKKDRGCDQFPDHQAMSWRESDMWNSL